MSRRFLFIMAMLFPCVLSAFAQEADSSAQAKANEIMANSDEYIYGLGYGDDPEEAYMSALSNMVTQISVAVEASSHIEMEESTGNGTRSSSEMFRSVVDSYTASVALEGVKALVLEDGSCYRRFVYIPRENIARMYERRRNKLEDLARSGIRARDNGKVDDALRHLYRAYVLLQSLPAPSGVTAKVDGEERVLANWIPETMRDIIDKVSFAIASVKKDETDPDNPGSTVELLVNYDGKPATTCTFKYGTAAGYSSLITARDGLAMIEVGPSVSMNPLKLYVEYLFRNENHTDTELKPLLGTFKGAGLVHNEFLLNEGKKDVKPDKKAQKAFQESVAAGANEAITALGKAESAPYTAAMEKILQCIESRRFNDIKPLCSADGWTLFERLMKYGRMKVLGNATRNTYEFYPFRDKVVCRSIPMSFSFSNGKRTFTEDMTFTFNRDGKLDGLAFGLGSIARKDIFDKKGAAWTDDKKMVLVNFLENYRTAFSLGLQDYIESIFDDNAVIIVGHVTKPLQRVKTDGGMILNTGNNVTYARKTKKEYMEQLRRCFQSQEFINVRFSDTDVERSGVGGETYAIQLKQDYVSQTYGDQGYLFLFVDFNDVDKPQIHVRTWQPERNPDLTPNLPPDHPRAGIFSPASF